MKKHALLFGLCLSLLFIVSCNKKDATAPANTTPTTLSVKDYYPLVTGDYWIYKQTQYDTSGNIMTQTWINDSVLVKNDTVINSKTYHTVVNYNLMGATTPSFGYYRDSSDCIVNNHGKIIFSINTSGIIFKDILTPDTMGYVNYSYNGVSTSITVPMGIFSCVDLKGDVYRKVDNFSKSYLIHNYTCKNIGPVKRMMIYINALYRINLELISYHLH